MSICVLYIMLSGGVFITPGCVVDQGVTYPDQIVYTEKLPREYSYAPLYRPVYRPKVVYRGYWPRNYRHYNRWLQRPRHRATTRHSRRNITLHYRTPTKTKVVKRGTKKGSKGKKNKFKKKK